MIPPEPGVTVSAPTVDDPPPTPRIIEFLLHPAAFFAAGVPVLSGKAKVGIMVVMGLAAGIDRVSLRLDGPIGESWVRYWGTVAGIAVLGGPLRWFIGSALFRLRLRLSGARGVDGRQATTLYVLSNLVCDATSVVGTMLATLTYGSPREEPFALGVVVSLAWSLFIGYQGARALFPVRAWPARFWLLILPGLFFVGLMAMLMFRS